MSRLTIFLVIHAHASSVLQNAHPRSDAALQMARPHHLCCPPGHGASASASSQNMASPHTSPTVGNPSHKPNGCTISLSSMAVVFNSGMHRAGIKRMSPSSFMLLAATSFPLAPRAF